MEGHAEEDSTCKALIQGEACIFVFQRRPALLGQGEGKITKYRKRLGKSHQPMGGMRRAAKEARTVGKDN